jgi:D-alanine-D-alanine ligase
VAHQLVDDTSGAADRDVLVQAAAVVAALERGGHRVYSISATLDLAQFARELQSIQPDVVFNLVESLGGTDRLMSLVPQLLDAVDVPYTGSGGLAIQQSGNKLVAKRLLRKHGLPTPDWFADDQETLVGGSYIVKPVSEHASRGIDAASVIGNADERSLRALIDAKNQHWGIAHFAERFVAGREFNVSLLGGADGELAVLPLAEIDFAGLEQQAPAIVGHAAKWDESSMEYAATPRRFGVDRTEPLLANRIAELARKCAAVFDASGYARVDLRVDSQGQPWILELNCNPCLSPDAGFAAAVEQAGLTFDAAIASIVAAGLANWQQR